MSTTILRELSDPLSLDFYHPHGITTEERISDLDLDAYVPLPRYSSTLRGISGLGGRTPRIFDRDIDTSCPNPRMDVYVDGETGEIIERPHTYWNRYLGRHLEAPCERNSCPACAVRNARRIAGAIYVSQPTHVLPLTQVGDAYPVVRKRLTNFFTEVRRTYPSVMYTWQVEANPAGTGAHALSYLHLEDESLSVLVLDRARARVGFGPVFEVERIPQAASVIYFGYQMKDLLSERRDSFLDLNGTPSRLFLVHASRGFYRDGMTGKKLSRSQAESLALRRSR